MNQIYSEPVRIELMVFLLGLTVYLIGYLKYKNEKPGAEPPAGGGSIINQARNWYDRTYLTARDATPPEQNLEKFCLNWHKKFKPNWLKARQFSENGTKMVEIPVLKNGEMILSFSRHRSTGFDFNKTGTITSLLIIEQPGDFDIYAMTVVGSQSYLRTNSGELKNNTYQKKERDFDGVVFFNNMDGTFVNGWRYQNGLIVSQLRQLSANSWGILTEKIPDFDHGSSRGSFAAVALWEDRIFGDDRTVHHSNTYITSSTFSEYLVGKGISILGGIDETLDTHNTLSHRLPSKLRLEQELRKLKVGLGHLN